jgi:hypothetical protein
MWWRADEGNGCVSNRVVTFMSFRTASIVRIFLRFLDSFTCRWVHCRYNLLSVRADSIMQHCCLHSMVWDY